jgi:hypothetical protein
VLGSEICTGEAYTQKIENPLDFRTIVSLGCTLRCRQLIHQRDYTKNVIEAKYELLRNERQLSNNE